MPYIASDGPVPWNRMFLIILLPVISPVWKKRWHRSPPPAKTLPTVLRPYFQHNRRCGDSIIYKSKNGEYILVETRWVVGMVLVRGIYWCVQDGTCTKVKKSQGFEIELTALKLDSPVWCRKFTLKLWGKNNAYISANVSRILDTSFVAIKKLLQVAFWIYLKTLGDFQRGFIYFPHCFQIIQIYLKVYNPDLHILHLYRSIV